MFNCSTIPSPQTGVDSFLNSIIRGEEFKAIVNQLFEKTSYARIRRFYIYEPYDYIIVKLYAICMDLSTHDAAEELNYIKQQNWNQTSLIQNKFQDKIRKRRYSTSNRR